MKTKLLLTLTALLALADVAHAQGTAFTYQGRLNDAAGPATGTYDFQFTVRDALTGGSPVGVNPLAATLAVSNGLFTVTLDPDAGVFTGADRWLEIAVRTNGGGAFTTLSPRQAITATPYAVTAGAVTGTVPLAHLPPSLVTNGATSVILSGTLGGNGAGLTNLNAANLTGTVADSALSANVALLDRPVQSFTGGTNTFAGKVGIGTSNPQQALQVVGNILGGGPNNAMAPGLAESAIVSGSGNSIQPDSDSSFIGSGQQNSILSFHSVLGGGFGNAIQPGAFRSFLGGGTGNSIQTNSQHSFLGGGAVNSIQTDSYYSFLGGGSDNSIQPNSAAAVVVGGQYNSAGGFVAAVLGGFANRAGAQGSVVLGGGNNTASGVNAIAAGSHAVASHSGSFVFADSQTGDDFASASDNSFNVRARGGINFMTVGAGMMLDGQTVLTNQSSGVTLNGTFGGTLTGNGSGLTSLNAASLTGALPAISGASLTSLNGASLSGNLSVGQILASGGIGSAGNYTNHIQGAHLEWNKDGGGGATWLLNQKGLGAGGIIFGEVDNANEVTERMRIAGSGNVGIGNANPNNRLMVVNARCDGSSWINASDRNLKEGFTPVSAQEILARVAVLPIQSWSYRAQPEQKHLGPVAQDFRAAFGLGQDDTSIATVDADGVALAAIQGLNEKVEVGRRKSEVKIQQLEAENAGLKARLEKLEQLLHAMNGGAR